MAEAQWYIVHTYTGYENRVATDLATMVEARGMQDYICDIKIPMQTVTQITNGVEREVERIIFPSYVFVKMIVTDESWYVVRNTRGCTGLVGSGLVPVPLTETEVARFGLEGDSAQEHGVEVSYRVGDNVKIISGPFESFGGVIKSIDLENNNVCVMISAFGRETPVELELDQISAED